MTSPRRRSALIADDNRDAGETLSALLSLLNFEVVVVANGHAALVAANERHPDLMFLDIGMPELTGWQVCERIRATTWGRDIKIIALTGYGQEGDRERSMKVGFDRHCTKPMLYDTLVKLLHDVHMIS